MKRIAINGLCTGNLSGTGYYTQELILALAKIDPANRYYIFLPESCLLPVSRQSEDSRRAQTILFSRRLRAEMNRNNRLEAILVPDKNRAGRVLWENLYLPSELKRLGCDLLHSPTGLAPGHLPCPSVITLHDLAFLKYPELFPWLQRKYLNWQFPRSASMASAVITDSETIRGEIVEHLPVPEEKVRPIALGVRSDFRRVEDEKTLKRLKAAHRLPEQFILALGTVEPRKNLLTLLEAFKQVSEEEPEIQLVLTGRRGWKEEPVFEKIEQLQLASRIRWTGFISRSDLAGLYTLAELSAYLSLYEGFGLPVLESMACGTPVVVSDIPVFQEWAGGAAALVEPDDPRQVADRIMTLLNNPSRRNELSERGLEKAEKFSWERTAEKTVKIYEQTATNGG